MRDIFIEGSARYVSVSALINQLDTDMRASGRGGYRPNEIPGLVQSAVSRIVDRQQRGGLFHHTSEGDARRILGGSLTGERTRPGDDDITAAINSR